MNLQNIPDKPGVYIMKDAAEKIYYIGKASNLRKRVASYFAGEKERKINLLLGKIRVIDYIVASSEREALILEDALVKKYMPFYNVLLRDDKSFPYIKISAETWPSVSVARRAKQCQKTRDVYYGPYPEASNLKKLVEWLKETFGIRACSYNLDETKKDFSSCFYLQSKKCSAPCLGKISKSEYKNRVAAVRYFLKGRFGKIKKQLALQMNRHAAKLEFEQASHLKKILDALNSMNEKIRFREITECALEALSDNTRKLAGLQSLLSLKKFPAEIDAIDISNFGVGSAVRLRLGEPDKSNYRRYRIKAVEEQNDFAMIEEVVDRRYARMLREGERLPDLVLIDGGAGQLEAAWRALKQLELLGKIDIISLSKGKKGEDQIHTTAGKIVNLERSDRGLHILQRARDEAHRFAVSYHRLLRKKAYAFTSKK